MQSEARQWLGLIRHLARYVLDCIMWIPDEIAIYRQYQRDMAKRRREDALRAELSRVLEDDPQDWRED